MAQDNCHGSLNQAQDVVLTIMDLLDVQNNVALGSCNRVFKCTLDVEMDRLFGALFPLFNDTKIESKLKRIPTFNKKRVNASSISVYNSFVKFHRGIDYSSDLPFLIFDLTQITANLRIFTVEQSQNILVIFNGTGIHSIFVNKIKQNNPALTMDDIIYLLKYERVYGIFNVPQSLWIHSLDVAQERQHHATVRRRVKACFLIFCTLLCAVCSFLSVYYGCYTESDDGSNQIFGATLIIQCVCNEICLASLIFQCVCNYTVLEEHDCGFITLIGFISPVIGIMSMVTSVWDNRLIISAGFAVMNSLIVFNCIKKVSQ